MNNRTQSKHFNSNTHINRKEYGIVVKNQENINPKIDEVDKTLRDVIKNCRGKFFHIFEYRCMYYPKFT